MHMENPTRMLWQTLGVKKDQRLEEGWDPGLKEYGIHGRYEARESRRVCKKRKFKTPRYAVRVCGGSSLLLYICSNLILIYQFPPPK